ncbi:MAG TPA: PAS domain S-box protein [Dongiaceae bacterium]|nr:PAS domain S-box protein [Dongiaceae bacterium]
MLSVSDTLYLAVNFQLLLTLFLVVLLWSLYYWIQRFRFFRWWAWAWTAFVIFLASATISLRIGPAWTPAKVALIATLLLAGFAQPFLLVCGGLSWHAPSRPSRRFFWNGVMVVVAAAGISLFLGYAYRSIPSVSFALRNAPRSLSMVVALCCCFAVFWHQFRTSRSYAAAITGAFCFAYAFDQSIYFLSFCKILFEHFQVSYPVALTRITKTVFSVESRLLFLDLVDTCGICLGMILLLVERFRHTAFELERSERSRRGLAEDNASLQSEIESRDKAEQELRRSEALSRQLILSSPVAMIVSRESGQEHVLANDRFTALFGYSKEDVRDIEAWWPRAYPDPEYRGLVEAQWRALLDRAGRGETEKLSMEARVRCKDGGFRDIEFHVSLVNDLHLVSFVDLTERKRAEKELRASEERYRDLVEHSEDLIGTHDLNGQILSINEAPCKSLGYTVDQVLKMNMRELLAPRFRHLYVEFVQRVLQHGHAAGQMVVVTQGGEERVWDYVSTLRTEGVPAPLIRGVARDVTEKFRAEEAMRRSEAKFATAFRCSPNAMTITSLRDGRFIDVNAAFERQSGYIREEVVGKTVQELGLWADEKDFAAVMADSLAREKVIDREVRLRNKAGQLVTAIYSVEVIHVGGEPCALAAGEDITDRLQMERALRESEAKFRSVTDLAACAIWILQDGHIVYLNQSVINITGYTRQELLDMDAQALVHPDFRDPLRMRAEARRRLTNYQYKICTKSGEERWLELTDNFISYEGRPAILCSAFDITAAKQAEMELQERTLYLESLIANSPLGIVVKDEQRRVLFCNPAFEQMFQYTQAELQGKDLDDFIAPHAREEAVRLSNSVQYGGMAQARTQRVRKDGTFLDVELYGVRVYSGDKFVASFVIYQDITERKKSEEKLLALRNRISRAQEEERARIARDLHDDTGQRLALLSIDLEQLKQASIKLKSSLTHQLEALVKAASEITSDVHNASRRLHPSQVELLGLVPALSNFCKDFSARNGMEIQFYHESLHHKPPQDAALCLFRVAQEAIRNVQKHSGTRSALVQLDENSGSLRLRVSDHGSGFDLEASEPPQGLGLLSMQERLHSLGGELFVHSRPGGGTCIEACIPLKPAVPA